MGLRVEQILEHNNIFKEDFIIYNMQRGKMNKRGLDAIVTTLIIILLAIVAIGIIWVVVRNVVQQGSEQIDISSKCIAVDLRAVSVSPVSGQVGNYSVTLNRRAGGDAIGGVKVSLFNDTANGGVRDFGVTLNELDTKTQTVVGVTEANKLEYTAYFVDASGNEQLCSQTGTFTF